MVRGGCRGCGQRTTNARLCNQCQRLERRGFGANSTDAFAPDRDDEDDEDDDSPDVPEEPEFKHECCACGEFYYTEGGDPCPSCGARRRRYVGPLPGEEDFRGRKALTDGGREL